MLSPQLPRSAASARLLLEVAVGELGLTPESALRGTGLDAERLSDPNLEIRSSQEQRLIENMVAGLGPDSDAALVAGSRYTLNHFGMLGFACMSSPTTRGVLDLTLRYQDLTFTLARADQVRRGGTTLLRIDPSALPEGIRRFVVDHGIATAWVTLLELNGGRLPGARIELEHSRPRYAERYRELLGVEPRFGGGGNHISLPDALLDQPRPLADPVALELCERDCRKLLDRRRAEGGARGLVYDRLSRATGLMPSMAMVAFDLNMSVRTLRRALGAEGTSFRAIDETVRRERAEELLVDHQLGVEQIAESLGYASSAGFVRAFRRWHGTTPGRWRKRAVAEIGN
jgi:AraC-like DNA-binding protein